MRGAGGVRIRDLLSMTGVGGVISGLVRVRRARFARHRRRLQTALGLLALDSLRRRVDARLDEPPRSKSWRRPGAHHWPPQAWLLTHQSMPAALSNRPGGPDQPPQGAATGWAEVA